MKGKHEYADSAPLPLVELHMKWPEALGKQAVHGWLYRLVCRDSEPVMKKVWQTLARRTPPPLHEVEDLEKWKADTAGAFLWQAVEMAMRPPPPHWRKSPGEKAEELMTIAKKARELSRLVARSQYFGKMPVYDLLSKEALSAIANNLNAVDYIERRFMREGESFNDALVFAMPQHPTAEHVLEALAEHASEKAKTHDIVKRKTRNYEAVYFARVMTSHMLKHYGQPLRGVVAAVGSLFFSGMDEKFVRDNAKRTRE